MACSDRLVVWVLTRASGIWINHTRATITAGVVGTRLPPEGSTVTSTRVIPVTSPGTPSAAVPREVTSNSVLGVGGPLPRCSQSS